MTLPLVARMPEVLRWTGGEEALRQTHDDYVHRLGDCLGTVVRRLGAAEPARADLIVRDLRDASDEALARVLTAPETSFRLLRLREMRLSEVADYLHGCLLAEAAREGQSVPLREERWTAPGDAHILLSGAVEGAPPLGGRVPVDLDSPWSNRVDLTDAGTRPTSPLPTEARAPALASLEEALRNIAAVSERAARMVVAFVKVLVPRYHPDDDLFCSCSNHRFIGRTVVINPHHPAVGQPRLAEALVHESVHSVLYMQMVQHDGCGVDRGGSEEIGLPSPWTGRMLPLSSFVHACFVWYGLAHFWGLALRNGAFPAGQAAPRLARAVVGFRGPSFLSMMGDSGRRRVLPVVRDAIDVMQSSLSIAMRGAEPPAELRS